MCCSAARAIQGWIFSKSCHFKREEKKYSWVKASKQPENYSEKSPFLCPFYMLLHVPSARVHSKQTPDTVSTVKSPSSTTGMAHLPQESTYASEHPPQLLTGSRRAHFPGYMSNFCSWTWCLNSGLTIAGETPALLNS